MIPESINQLVIACARGSYQTALLEGRETWSGASLSGSAKHQWGARYAESRAALAARIAQALKPVNWSARLVLVLIRGRIRRRLVLVDPHGIAYDWHTDLRLLEGADYWTPVA